MGKLIYIAEDEENIRELIKCALESYQYEVQDFDNGKDLLAALEQKPADLVLLDIMMPQTDGITALKMIRSNPNLTAMPVIMITARSTEIDKVRGLDAGADDYLTKPFGLLELSARVRSALRRTQAPVEQPATTLTVGELQLDLENREVYNKDAFVELTFKEFELLRMLVKNKERIVPREELLDKIWGYDYIGETRTLDMHIRTLRSKLGDSAENPIYIKTVRGVGYKFIAR